MLLSLVSNDLLIFNIVVVKTTLNKPQNIFSWLRVRTLVPASKCACVLGDAKPPVGSRTPYILNMANPQNTQGYPVQQTNMFPAGNGPGTSDMSNQLNQVEMQPSNPPHFSMPNTQMFQMYTNQIGQSLPTSNQTQFMPIINQTIPTCLLYTSRCV